MADAGTAEPLSEDPPEGIDTPELRERVKDALREEGFRWEIWQKPERGVAFGMIRRDDEHMQTHVRYYDGGVIKAERELCHRYIEHLVSPRESMHEEVERLLAEHGITEIDVREKEFPDRMKRDMPKTRTPWKPLALGLGAVVAGAVFGTRALLPFGDD